MNKVDQILHINTHDYVGGAAKVAYRLLELQNKLGRKSSLITAHKGSNNKNVEEFEPRSLNKEFFINRGLLDLEFQGSHQLIANKLFKEARIIHYHNLHGEYFNPYSIYLHSACKPVVWTLHDMQALTGHCAHSFECSKWETGCDHCPGLNIYPAIKFDSTSELWKLKKEIYDNSEFVITVPSMWLKRKVEKSILKKHRCELIYNGVDTKIFSPGNKEQIREKYNIPENLFIIGGVANDGAIGNPWKGGNYILETLDKVFENISNAVFLNVGSNKESANERIINIPPIQNEYELAEIYSIMDLYLTTSIADNAPLVVLEALSCGLPVVSFETGGIPELIENGKTGVISEYKNSEAIAGEIIQLFKNQQILKEFSINARLSVLSKFDNQSIACQYLKLYDEISVNANSTKINLEKLPNNIKTIEFLNAIETIKKIKTAPTYLKNECKKISIVTPSFNQGEFLEECIDSVLSQNYPNLEYIIMDGGSTDESVEIIKKYEKYVDYWQSRKDNGQYWAINEGFSKATGDIMAWLNSDDKYHKNAFYIVDEIFQNYDVNWITGRPTHWGKLGEAPKIAKNLENWDRLRLLNEFKQEHKFIQQESTFWNRELWTKAGGYISTESNLIGDFELWLRFFRHSELKTFDFLLGGFRKHEEQKTAGERLKKYIAEAEALIDKEKLITVSDSESMENKNPLFEQISHKVENVPHMKLMQAERLSNFFSEQNISSVLELGFAHGVSTLYMAGILESLKGGKIVSIDNVSAKVRNPNIENLFSEFTFNKTDIEIFFEQKSYNWRLMKFIEAGKSNVFDFCYLDGAHDWYTDGFAFFLVDKLLKPGGWIIFDDMSWSYATSPSLKNTAFVKSLPDDEKNTPQISKVFELLVQQHPSYGNFKIENNWGYAQKLV